MKSITNKGRRRLGIPGRPALVLDPNQSESVSSNQIAEMGKNKTVIRWLAAGVLVLTDDGEKIEEPFKGQPAKGVSGLVAKPRQRVRVDRDKRETVELPEGVEGEGIEIYTGGAGWYDVYVNGFKVTDRKVRKDEAESIADEYE